MLKRPSPVFIFAIAGALGPQMSSLELEKRLRDRSSLALELEELSPSRVTRGLSAAVVDVPTTERGLVLLPERVVRLRDRAGFERGLDDLLPPIECGSSDAMPVMPKSSVWLGVASIRENISVDVPPLEAPTSVGQNSISNSFRPGMMSSSGGSYDVDICEKE